MHFRMTGGDHNSRSRLVKTCCHSCNIPNKHMGIGYSARDPKRGDRWECIRWLILTEGWKYLNRLFVGAKQWHRAHQHHIWTSRYRRGRGHPSRQHLQPVESETWRVSVVKMSLSRGRKLYPFPRAPLRKTGWGLWGGEKTWAKWGIQMYPCLSGFVLRRANIVKLEKKRLWSLKF